MLCVYLFGLSVIFLSICCGLFFRIRFDLEELKNQRNHQITLIERLMRQIVCKKEMEEYLEKIKEMSKDIEKDRWENIRKAFSGKEE